MRFDKIAGSDFEQPKAGPEGAEGRIARSTDSPGANQNARSAARRAKHRKYFVTLE
jgi:hypothetical protein